MLGGQSFKSHDMFYNNNYLHKCLVYTTKLSLLERNVWRRCGERDLLYYVSITHNNINYFILHGEIHYSSDNLLSNIISVTTKQHQTHQRQYRTWTLFILMRIERINNFHINLSGTRWMKRGRI